MIFLLFVLSLMFFWTCVGFVVDIMKTIIEPEKGYKFFGQAVCISVIGAALVCVFTFMVTHHA